LSHAERILRKIENASETQFLPIIGLEKGRMLASIVRGTRPKHVLEVGIFIGYFAILVGKELNADTHVIAR
jgi:predicted O-methyltransferase YrrM